MEERRRKQTTEEDKKKKKNTVSRTEPPIIAFVEERQEDNNTKLGPDRCQIYQERKVETNTCQILWLILMHIVPTIVAIITKNNKIYTFLKNIFFYFRARNFLNNGWRFPPNLAFLNSVYKLSSAPDMEAILPVFLLTPPFEVPAPKIPSSSASASKKL